jgi:succinyl-diaminopimelate desuccinylase
VIGARLRELVGHKIECVGSIQRWLQEREQEMADLLMQLIAIPTENPPGTNLSACADLLERHLREAGLPCERVFDARGGAGGASPASLLSESGSGDRALYFHGHYDVVPAQSPDQFRPTRKDHFVFGRGSCDMKGGIVAMLYAIRALRERESKVNEKIVLSLVPDEETGGAQGSAWLARQDRLGKGVGMLMAEPTSGVVWNANRGAITVRVTLFGKSAHVGLQHLGENAFERMHRVVTQLLELKREVEQQKTGCHIGRGQSGNSILLLGGQNAGGTNFNVVPDCCWFTIDRRINPEENLQEEKSRLLDVLEQCRRDGIPLEWQILQEGESALSGESEPVAQALARSIEAVTGKPACFEMCPGLLETRYYAAQGVPAYGYGPGLLSVAHGPDEYVNLRRVIDCAAVYALTALDILDC